MNNFKTAILLALLTGILLAAGKGFGGNAGMTLMLIVSLVMNFVSYWYSDKIVLKMYKAQEINAEEAPELFNMVLGLVKEAGLPMPRVYIINESAPNAFATGRDPEHAAVAVTAGILKALSPAELKGVLAHELAHVKNRDTLISTVAATIAGVITWMAQIASWAMIFTGRGGDNDRDEGGGLFGGLLMIILAPLAATVIQLAISRSREYQADAVGAHISGAPLALASALEKIEYYAKQRQLPEATPATSPLFIINPLHSGFVMKLFSTHPPTAERIEKLKEIALTMR